MHLPKLYFTYVQKEGQLQKSQTLVCNFCTEFQMIALHTKYEFI